MPRDPKAEIKAALNQMKPKGKKRSKYSNKKTELDGIEFDSKREAKRWPELQLMERAGLIKDLTRQRHYAIKVNGFVICEYWADFDYVDCKTGKLVVEDVKSSFTRTLPVYKLKKKLMQACYGIEIREV